LIGLLLFLGIGAVIGAVAVIPTLPREWLLDTPFPDYTVPALALGLIGVSALASAALLLAHVEWGVALSAAVGVGIAVFEVVESLVVGLDYWLHALGLGPAPSPIAGAESVGALLGIPIPLWLQPFYFVLGVIIVGLSLLSGLRAAAARNGAGERAYRYPSPSSPATSYRARR
jgi:hypothetical protein